LIRFSRNVFSRSISSSRKRMKFIASVSSGITIHSSAFTRRFVVSIAAQSKNEPKPRSAPWNS
jgi:hypothetical protein